MPTRSRSLHLVRVARPAAVGLVRARRQHRAEHAVLHVEHRHVLVNDHFQPLRAARRRPDPAVDRDSRSYDAVMRSAPCSQQPLDRQFVGGVERKIGDDRHAARAKNASPPRLRTRMPSAPCFAQSAEDADLRPASESAAWPDKSSRAGAHAPAATASRYSRMSLKVDVQLRRTPAAMRRLAIASASGRGHGKRGVL